MIIAVRWPPLLLHAMGKHASCVSLARRSGQGTVVHVHVQRPSSCASSPRGATLQPPGSPPSLFVPWSQTQYHISHSAQPSTCLACDISFFCRIRPLSNVPSAHTLIAASHFPGAVVNHVCLPAMAGNRDAQSIHQQGCATDAGTSYTLNFCSLHLRANSAKASRVHVVNDYTTQPRR